MIGYTILCVPETNPFATESSAEKKSLKQLAISAKEGALLYRKNGNRTRQIQLICLSVAFFVDQVCKSDEMMSIVQISWLCWGPIAMSYYSSITKMTKSVFGIATSRFCKQRISDNMHLLFSLISGTLQPIVVAFTTTAWMFYTGWCSFIFEHKIIFLSEAQEILTSFINIIIFSYCKNLFRIFCSNYV